MTFLNNGQPVILISVGYFFHAHHPENLTSFGRRDERRERYLFCEPLPWTGEASDMSTRLR